MLLYKVRARADDWSCSFNGFFAFFDTVLYIYTHTDIISESHIRIIPTSLKGQGEVSLGSRVGTSSEFHYY